MPVKGRFAPTLGCIGKVFWKMWWMPPSQSLEQVCAKRLAQKVSIVEQVMQLMVSVVLVAPFSPTVADKPKLQV